MLELKDIEELFKNEELSKNRAAIHALLNHAATLHREGVSPEAKASAIENIKAITSGKPPKAKKVKEPKVKAEAPKVPFHEEFTSHHGGDPVKFKAAYEAMSPEQQKVTTDWHHAQLAAKVKKSVSNLYSLISELKKRL